MRCRAVSMYGGAERCAPEPEASTKLAISSYMVSEG